MLVSSGRRRRRGVFSLGGLVCTCCSACAPCVPPATDLTVTVSGTYQPCVGGSPGPSTPYSHAWPIKYYPTAGPVWCTDCLSDGPFFSFGEGWKFKMVCIGGSNMGMQGFYYDGFSENCPTSPASTPASTIYNSSLTSYSCSPLNLVFTLSSAIDLVGAYFPDCSGTDNYHLTTVTVTP